MHGDETAYSDEVRALSEWCNGCKLCFNVSKMNTIIVDDRKLQMDGHTLLYIGGASVERARSTEYLWVHLFDDLA